MSGHRGEFKPVDLAQLQMASPIVTVGGKLYQQAVQRSEYYVGKAKEAMGSGDRFASEGFLQHADHYSRIILEANELNREHKERQQQNRSQPSQGNREEEGEASLPQEATVRMPRQRRHNTSSAIESSGARESERGNSDLHDSDDFLNVPLHPPIRVTGQSVPALREETEE